MSIQRRAAHHFKAKYLSHSLFARVEFQEGGKLFIHRTSTTGDFCHIDFKHSLDPFVASAAIAKCWTHAHQIFLRLCSILISII
jgi:hypothetical protein